MSNNGKNNKDEVTKENIHKNNGSMDILELFSRNLDLEEKKVYYGTPGGSIGTDNFEIDPDTSPCLKCKFMLENCPKNIDSEKMELIRDCAHFEPSEIPESKLNRKKKIKKNKKKNREKEKKKEITIEEGTLCQFPQITENDFIEEENSSNSEFSNTKKSKQIIINKILAKWNEEHGKLRIFCAKCEQEMMKKVTLKKEFYMCSNFPECKTQGDPWYISKAVLKNVSTNKLKSDLVILYKFNKNKNSVNISEIYSEKKLFL
ncbi:MAG: hypothetical protein GY870_05130 [archaeon]|nr:hypothetical protein [archaeon]